jgi:hypothetical protein
MFKPAGTSSLNLMTLAIVQKSTNSALLFTCIAFGRVFPQKLMVFHNIGITKTFLVITGLKPALPLYQQKKGNILRNLLIK